MIEGGEGGVRHRSCALVVVNPGECDYFATIGVRPQRAESRAASVAGGMGRPPRNFSEGIYHLGSHGSDTRYLYAGDDDRFDFLERMSSTFWARDIDVLAYALLGNHYHGLVRTPDARLSEALQRLHTEYSRQHNRRHRRRAHLFRAHCFARRVIDTDDLLGVYRYIARNPVEAGLVDNPFDWRWASTRAHAGLDPPAIPLDETPLRGALGDTLDWRRRYAEPILSNEKTNSVAA
jgi:REP-associated tyrosine transposase